MTARPAPSRAGTDPAPATANDRFKASFSGRLWGSLIAATLLHFAVFAFWPEMVAPDVSFAVDVPEAVELPPEVDIPEAPPRLQRPALPVVSPDVPADAVPPEFPDFEDMDPGDLPPPPTSDEGRGVGDQPTFTPYEVAPRLLNADQVRLAMERAYPAILRDAGLGGTVLLHFFIDADGVVQDARIAEGSGHQRLDEAALELAETYRFSPALNRDQRVPVWIRLPITFQVRQ